LQYVVDYSHMAGGTTATRASVASDRAIDPEHLRPFTNIIGLHLYSLYLHAASRLASCAGVSQRGSPGDRGVARLFESQSRAAACRTRVPQPGPCCAQRQYAYVQIYESLAETSEVVLYSGVVVPVQVLATCCPIARFMPDVPRLAMLIAGQ
jgi:hypothetical protein